MSQNIQVSVTWSETFSLPEYENTKPSVAITDSPRPGETLGECYERLRQVCRYLGLRMTYESLRDHMAAGKGGNKRLLVWLENELEGLESLDSLKKALDETSLDSKAPSDPAF